MSLPLRDNQYHTYGEYLHWDDDARFELIDGQAWAMSPAPNPRHQQVLGELYRQIANQLHNKSCSAWLAPFDVRLPRANETDEDIDTVVQPDLSVICDSNKIDDKGCRGAPDWVIEILSPSTAGHDQVIKRRLYERAGVREYWLLHPTDQVLTVYRLIDGSYGKPDVDERKETTHSIILPEIVIDWSLFK